MYYYIGFIVFWGFILIVLCCLLIILYYTFDAIFIKISQNDRIMFFFGRNFETKTLRTAFSMTKNRKVKRLIAKYRNRNIKKQRYENNNSRSGSRFI